MNTAVKLSARRRGGLSQRVCGGGEVRVRFHDVVEMSQFQRLLHLARGASDHHPSALTLHGAEANGQDADPGAVDEVETAQIQYQLSRPLPNLLPKGPLDVERALRALQPRRAHNALHNQPA
jgi:hypothetical protein